MILLFIIIYLFILAPQTGAYKAPFGFVFAISRIRKNTSYRINILIVDALYMFVLEDFILMICVALLTLHFLLN